MFEYALRDCRGSDKVATTICNQGNVKDGAVGLSFRRKDKFNENVVWLVFEKVTQSNVRFNALDKLNVDVHSVRMPVGFGRVKMKGKPLSVMAHFKMSVVEVKAENNCLACALIIAIARVTNDPNYNTYRKGRKIRPVIDKLLKTTGIDLKDGGGIPEVSEFQKRLKGYGIVVYGGLNCEDIDFDRQVKSKIRLNLYYDDLTCQYHVITNVTVAKDKRYVCKACGKGYDKGGDVTHKYDQVCSDCMSIPPCACADVRIPCESCNRTFRRLACFNWHKTNKLRGKAVCEQKRNCPKFGLLLTRKQHECFKMYCENCNACKEVGHLCYKKTLKNELPRSIDVFFVFYDFETTQYTKFAEMTTLHVPNLLCLQQFCMRKAARHRCRLFTLWKETPFIL
jgi:hypothetical protein